MKWISVEERLPDIGELVVVVMKHHYQHCAPSFLLAAGKRIEMTKRDRSCEWSPGEWDIRCISCSYDAFTLYIDNVNRFVLYWIPIEEFNLGMSCMLPTGIITMGLIFEDDDER